MPAAEGRSGYVVAKTDFGAKDGKLGISALGGTGGNGQPGQEGSQQQSIFVAVRGSLAGNRQGSGRPTNNCVTQYCNKEQP
jgi:hypothetical protein